jgi:hypothetical protein
MNKAIESDLKSIENKERAVERFKILAEITNTLIMEDNTTPFQESGGFNMLILWLTKLPDGTLPNARIALTILKGIKCLTEHIYMKDINEIKLLKQEINMYA